MNTNEKFLTLIVDDDDLFRQFAKFILEKNLDVEVVGCKSPTEAFDFLEKRIPALILLDMEMPVMDGYSFLRKLRLDKRFENIHVIPCTALASKDLFASLLKLGIDDYILKPPTDKVLVSKVKRVIDFLHRKTSDKGQNLSDSDQNEPSQ
ncbi:response regulator [Bacteroidetes/Chlorobi group bacterium Naka2016]|jgi:CheY-like chemotaxis protein|nr:MAG: response regulator [Bacteroidetes/Chlorobi group bacterium Naka2016]